MTLYKLTNTVNGKMYVGQTTRSLSIRMAAHRRGFCAVGKAIIKYGWDNFELVVLATAQSLDELNQLEKDHILTLNTRAPSGYNIHPGGNNHQWTDELKARFSTSRKGQGNPVFGRRYKMAESTKQKLREIRTGKPNISCRIPILCLTTGTSYPSLADAARDLNLRGNKISLVCQGKRKSTGDLQFAYIKEVIV